MVSKSFKGQCHPVPVLANFTFGCAHVTAARCPSCSSVSRHFQAVVGFRIKINTPRNGKSLGLRKKNIFNKYR